MFARQLRQRRGRRSKQLPNCATANFVAPLILTNGVAHELEMTGVAVRTVLILPYGKGPSAVVVHDFDARGDRAEKRRMPAESLADIFAGVMDEEHGPLNDTAHDVRVPNRFRHIDRTVLIAAGRCLAKRVDHRDSTGAQLLAD